MRCAGLFVLTLVVVVLSSSYVSTTGRRVMSNRATLPGVMLWAWERPADLRGLGKDTGVAFFAQTILVGDRVTVTPRRHPLRVSPETPLVAVTRIESPEHDIARLDEDEIEEVASQIARTATLPRVVAVQIDFDAADSERDAYRRLLVRVRQLLPSGLPLSMTALASWCVGDAWLDGLPIDEVVPMLFRMGPVNQPYASIGAHAADAVPECRGAIGISLDEPLRIRTQGRRLYVFNSDPWNAAAVTHALEIR